jgi:hypothetical protein
VEERDHEEGDRNGDRAREDRVERLRECVLAERTDAQAGGGHAELHRRDEARRVVHDPQHGAGAAVAALCQLVHPRLPRRHERVLAGHEEGVQQDQRRNAEKFERDAHAGPASGGRLGMSSSSNRIYGSV